MPKLNTQERQAVAEKEAAELKKFQETVLPFKIIELMARANAIGSVSAYPTMAKESREVMVKFSFPTSIENYRSEKVLTFQSQPYDVEEVEQEFNMLEERENQRREKLKMAQEVYDSLTPQQREAIGMKDRPR